MFNVPAFREYVKTRLIGELTQASFAAEKGITPEHLSRMLRSENPSRPSKATLKKLAGESEGVYNELLSLCGYNDKKEKFILETKEDMIQSRVNELRDGFRDMTQGVHVYENMNAFLDEYSLLFDSKDVSFKMAGKKQEYDEGDHFGAEYVVPIAADYRFRGYECRIFCALYFSETIGGKVVVLDSALDSDSLLSSGLRYPEEKKDELLGRPYLCNIRKDYSAEEKLLEAIFGNGRNEEVTVSVIGFGISFKRSIFTDDAVKDFLEGHDASKYGIDAANRILAGESVSSVLDGYDTNMDVGEGPGCLIAQVIREETGIRFLYYQDVTGNENALDAVMVERDDYKDCDIDDLKEAASGLARDFGLREYGECLVYVHDYIDGKKRFRIGYAQDYIHVTK